MSFNNKTVAYYYDEEIGNYNDVNFMRPHRIRLTHSLVESYGLHKKVLLHRPSPTLPEQLELFHADEYIDFLSSVTPENQEEYITQMTRFNLGAVGEADCPVFDGMFEYFQIYTGGSVDGAAMLNQGDAQICVNWSGGAHHAKKAEASGFCYINDIVLAILELLKVHQRVLYVDIDIHHGDGVEEAFYATDRVMTVSFHKYGDFFPGTGALGDTGVDRGLRYSVNVPLQEGIDDESYQSLFEPIMQKVMDVYQPGAIVVCGGADSLSGDRLGCFNLSLEGHSHCLEFLAKFNVPMLILGGGGYTMRNVARCWCYETGRMLGLNLPDTIPDSVLEDYNYFMDTGKLRISVSNMKNANRQADLDNIRTRVLQQLAQLAAAPSAQMQTAPPQRQLTDAPEEDLDARGGGQYFAERRVEKDAVYGSDDEGEDPPTRNEGTAHSAALTKPRSIAAAIKPEPNIPAAGASPSYGPPGLTGPVGGRFGGSQGPSRISSAEGNGQRPRIGGAPPAGGRPPSEGPRPSPPQARSSPGTAHGPPGGPRTSIPIKTEPKPSHQPPPPHMAGFGATVTTPLPPFATAGNPMAGAQQPPRMVPPHQPPPPATAGPPRATPPPASHPHPAAAHPSAGAAGPPSTANTGYPGGPPGAVAEGGGPPRPAAPWQATPPPRPQNEPLKSVDVEMAPVDGGGKKAALTSQLAATGKESTPAGDYSTHHQPHNPPQQH